jgi:hypothetical protein
MAENKERLKIVSTEIIKDKPLPISVAARRILDAYFGHPLKQGLGLITKACYKINSSEAGIESKVVDKLKSALTSQKNKA